MGNGHSFGDAGGTGCVHDVNTIVCAGQVRRVAFWLLLPKRAIPIQAQRERLVRGQLIEQRFLC